MSKYDSKEAFNDPVVRCTECTEIVYREDIHSLGMCPHCGNRRVRNVLVLSEAEMKNLHDKNVDPDFLALFEGVA